jgi:putative SOS response-associated peptidase YedK
VDPRDGERELVMARWGLVPWWSKTLPKIPHINARAETVHEKSLFREAFAKRRALIPATGFFEWQKRADGRFGIKPTIIIFRIENNRHSVVDSGGERIRFANNDRRRQNLFVAEARKFPEPGEGERIQVLAAEAVGLLSIEDLRALLKPYSADRMRAEAVSRAVNSVKNDDEDCIAPIGEPPLSVPKSED